jgi:hypothetical protein
VFRLIKVNRLGHQLNTRVRHHRGPGGS